MTLRYCLLVTAAGFLAPITASAQEAGVVSSRACPYSCRTQGIPKESCRDWREGDTCFIEDMRGGAPRGRPENRAAETGSDAAARCRSMNRYDVQSPRVEVEDIRQTGNVFEDKVRVEGAIEGTCISEAGYYEDGKLVERIPIKTSTDFQRFEFDIKARRSRDPEVRVYNVFGGRDTFDIAESMSRDRGRGRYDDEYERRRDDYRRDSRPEEWSPIDGLLGR